MPAINVNIDTAVFNDVYVPYLNCMARTQIYFGGSSSGKSVFLAQRDVYDILGGGRNFLICRMIARTIRGSVFNEILKVIAAWGLQSQFDVNKSDRIITCANGYQFLFVGLDDTEKIKSVTPAKGVITDIRVEEATETDWTSIKQLYKRQRGGDPDISKRLTLSFNPILQIHWIYSEYFSGVEWADDQTKYENDDLSILKTWYIHNRFLTDNDVNDLENETDKYFRDVYTFGNWGVLGNVIFTNWHVRDISQMRNQFTNYRNGLDFGFSSNPAAIVTTHYDKNHKTIYIYDELYELGLTNDVLAVEVKSRIGRDGITCDSAEPKSIAELKRHGVTALPAVKGKDSVHHGIQWLKQQSIIIDVSCVNMKNEFQQYKWKEDKAGNALDQPIDRDNHLIDALRYAYEKDMLHQLYAPPKSVKYA